MDGMDGAVLAKMPLAEAVLTIWRFVADEDRLQAIFEQHRGRCYEQSISFATMVRLVADALLEHEGSGNQSFTRAHESGKLEATTRAAYGKLGRLPIALSVGWFDELSSAIAELFPEQVRRETAPCLDDFTIVTIDGKTVKRIAKRLKPLRNTGGGVIGGKALVATEYATGLAIALAADPDGDANDAKLVPDLLPQVRQRIDHPRLWVADRAFCDPLQISRFTEEGDSFVLRYNAKAKFTRDMEQSLREGADDKGRSFTDECGWLGRDGNKHQCYVRRITLHREEGDEIAIVTDLFGPRKHPANDLLALYRERWGIEQMFQQVTEIFGLKKLIGGRPEATIFQLAFCLLLYNQMQLVRAYVVKHQGGEAEDVSLEQLFIDVRRELIAWAVVVGPLDMRRCTARQTGRRLDKLLKNQWSDRWIKAIKASTEPSKPKPKTKTHTSAYRALLAAKT
jgi:PAS domain-containing protein